MRNPYHKPRQAHCVGCGYTYNKMHLMINHRRRDRCGGRFLPAEERELLETAKVHRQHFNATPEEDYDNYRWYWAQAGDMFSRFYLLRKRRLDEQESQALAR